MTRRNNRGSGIGKGFLGILLLMGAVVGWSFFSWNDSQELVRAVIIVIAGAAIFYFDNSGIRQSLVRRLPKGFPFYSILSVRRATPDRMTDLFLTATLVCLLISWATPHLRFVFTGLAILLPLLAVYRYLRYSELIHFGSSSRDKLSPTATILLVPTLLFIIWGLHNQDLSIQFWILFGAISGALVVAFFARSREYRVKKSVAAGFIVLAMGFTFGALSTVNQDFDFSEATIYQVEVLDKYIESGKSKTPMVTVRPWDGQEDLVDIAVDPEVYKSAIIGEKMPLVEHGGALGIRWYYLDLDDNAGL